MKKIKIKVPDWIDAETLTSCLQEIIGYKEWLIDDLNSYKKIGKYMDIQVSEEGYNLSNRKSLQALDKLMTLAEAWNHIDEFVPDLSDFGQKKFYPVFRDSEIARLEGASFMCVCAREARYEEYENLGSWCLFKTEERAEQFGKQFIDLWIEYLLNK